MRITCRDLYAATVSILLVSLGLGTIYLVVMERLEPLAGIALVIGTGALIWAGKALRDASEGYRRRA